MRKKALQVTLHVRQPSVVELTVGDKVQLDRLLPSKHGHVAERRGSLLDPGRTTLDLAQGFYYFKTLSDVNLKVVRGGVDASANRSGKDPWPDPEELPSPPAVGDEVSGEVPRLTVESSESYSFS
jgi:hypothetical protein